MVREWPRGQKNGGGEVMRGGRGLTRDKQERLRPGGQGAGDASRFDSRPALGRGGRKGGVEGAAAPRQ